MAGHTSGETRGFIEKLKRDDSTVKYTHGGYRKERTCLVKKDRI
jgi:hypothetical protein